MELLCVFAAMAVLFLFGAFLTLKCGLHSALAPLVSLAVAVFLVVGVLTVYREMTGTEKAMVEILEEKGCPARAFNPKPYQWFQVYTGIRSVQ